VSVNAIGLDGCFVARSAATSLRIDTSDTGHLELAMLEKLDRAIK
jgi:hypothetical protein